MLRQRPAIIDAVSSRVLTVQVQIDQVHYHLLRANIHHKKQKEPSQSKLLKYF